MCFHGADYEEEVGDGPFEHETDEVASPTTMMYTYIPKGNVVRVRVNSGWFGVGSKETPYRYSLNGGDYIHVQDLVFLGKSQLVKDDYTKVIHIETTGGVLIR